MNARLINSPCPNLDLIQKICGVFSQLHLQGFTSPSENPRVVIAVLETPLTQAQGRIFEQMLMQAAFLEGRAVAVCADPFYGEVTHFRFEVMA